MAFNPKLVDVSMKSAGLGFHDLDTSIFSRRCIATGRAFFATAPWKPCLVIRTSWPSPMKRPTFASTCPLGLTNRPNGGTRDVGDFNVDLNGNLDVNVDLNIHVDLNVNVDLNDYVAFNVNATFHVNVVFLM